METYAIVKRVLRDKKITTKAKGSEGELSDTLKAWNGRTQKGLWHHLISASLISTMAAGTGFQCQRLMAHGKLTFYLTLVYFHLSLTGVCLNSEM